VEVLIIKILELNWLEQSQGMVDIADCIYIFLKHSTLLFILYPNCVSVMRILECFSCTCVRTLELAGS